MLEGRSVFEILVTWCSVERLSVLKHERRLALRFPFRDLSGFTQLSDRSDVGRLCSHSLKNEDFVQKQKRRRKRKCTALIKCQNNTEFWTTQRQFWQWAREGVVVKLGDNPLTGVFRRENTELQVVFSNTVLNLAHPNHLREALKSRRAALGK